jgi:hypothetical protein
MVNLGCRHHETMPGQAVCRSANRSGQLKYLRIQNDPGIPGARLRGLRRRDVGPAGKAVDSEFNVRRGDLHSLRLPQTGSQLNLPGFPSIPTCLAALAVFPLRSTSWPPRQIRRRCVGPPPAATGSAGLCAENAATRESASSSRCGRRALSGDPRTRIPPSQSDCLRCHCDCRP